MANTGVKNAMGWVIGISTIALVLLVILIIFGNLSGNVGITTTQTTTYTNESGYLNLTRGAYTLSHMSDAYALSYAIIQVGANYTGVYQPLTSGNWTLSGNTITNATGIDGTKYDYQNVGITYVVTYNSGEYQQTQGVINNMTSGIGKLTTQIPTIFLFVGIGLLLSILIGVLAWVIKKMSNFGGFSSKGSVE